MGARKPPARSPLPRLGGLWLALLLALAACALAPDDAEGPARAVAGFVTALEDRDASSALALLEPTEWREELGPELRTYLGMLESIDVRDEAYSVVERSGDSAVVQLQGTVAYRFAEGGAGGERPVDLRVELVRVEGRWYLRGMGLPQLVG